VPLRSGVHAKRADELSEHKGETMILGNKLQQELDQLGDLIQLRDILVDQLKNVNDSISVSVQDVVSGKWHNAVVKDESIEF